MSVRVPSAAAATALLTMSLFAACEEARPNAEVSTAAPADAQAGLTELLRLAEESTFAILFRVGEGDEAEQLLWQRLPTAERWDSVSRIDGELSGISSITMTQSDDGSTCLWGVEERLLARAGCLPRPFEPVGGIQDALDTSDTFGVVRFLSRDVILGRDVECYFQSGSTIERLICLTEEGLPLRITANVGSNPMIGYSLEALEVRGLPDEASVLRPILPDHVPGTSSEASVVPTSSLALPDLPLLREYLESQDAEIP